MSINTLFSLSGHLVCIPAAKRCEHTRAHKHAHAQTRRGVRKMAHAEVAAMARGAPPSFRCRHSRCQSLPRRTRCCRALPPSPGARNMQGKYAARVCSHAGPSRGRAYVGDDLEAADVHLDGATRHKAKVLDAEHGAAIGGDGQVMDACLCARTHQQRHSDHAGGCATHPCNTCRRAAETRHRKSV